MSCRHREEELFVECIISQVSTHMLERIGVGSPGFACRGVLKCRNLDWFFFLILFINATKKQMQISHCLLAFHIPQSQNN